MNKSPNKNPELNNKKTFNKILKYLRDCNVEAVPYQILSSDTEINHISKNKYLVFPQIKGKRVWVVFVKLGEIYYAVNFPVKDRYHQEVTLYEVDVAVSKETYRGTILQGTYYLSEGKRYIVIDEVYYLNGQTQITKSKADRLSKLQDHIRKNFRLSPYFIICISSFYKINEESLSEFYQRLKKDKDIIGINFYPNTLGKDVYTYTLCENDLEDQIIQYSNYLMKKTSKVDVYDLYTMDGEIHIGIACIPDTKTSKICRDWFKTTKSKKIEVRCIKDTHHDNWIPIELLS